MIPTFLILFCYFLACTADAFDTVRKELRAALEAAKREAEQEVVKITYTRAEQKKEAKPSDLVKKADSFPAHLRREEIVKPLSEKDQSLVDSDGKVVRQLIQEVLCCKKPELFVKAYYREMLKEEQQSAN